MIFTLQIQARHNEVIAFNADLKENADQETEQEIQQLNNQLFGLQNKLENLHHSQSQAQKQDGRPASPIGSKHMPQSIRLEMN